MRALLLLPPVVGAAPRDRERVHRVLASYPQWFVRSARVSEIRFSRRPEIAAQLAMYEHGSRVLWVWAEIGDVLTKAMGHELAHGCDDIFGRPHYFSSTPEWQKIHRNQAYFDIPKYRDEALEYFADQFVKLLLLGPARLATTNPAEVTFLTSWAIPALQKEYGNG